VRSAVLLLTALALSAAGCRRKSAHADSRSRAPVRSAEWSAAFRLRSAVVPDLAPMDDVIVHAPPDYDATAPLHLVIVLHGLGHSALRWAGSGLPDPRTGRPLDSWGGQQRHDLAGTRTLLIAPQLDDRLGHPRLGRWLGRGGFRRFVTELLEETLAPRLGRHTLADVETVTLVGSSGGGPSIADLLERDDLDGRVRSVVLFDALYAQEPTFARWIAGGDAAHPRRLVCLHEGLAFTAPHVEALLTMLRPTMGAALVEQPTTSVTEAVRTHRAVFATVDCEHIGMGAAYLDKVLLGLDLPRRSGGADPKIPEPAVGAPTRVVRVGESVEGALSASDGRMHDGSHFDDYGVELGAGEAVTLSLLGHPVDAIMCRSLDVDLRVLDGDRVVADDDDGAGGRSSRVRFVAPRAGRYTLRAMTHGPWENFGGYTLRVER